MYVRPNSAHASTTQQTRLLVWQAIIVVDHYHCETGDRVSLCMANVFDQEMLTGDSYDGL